MKDRGKQSLYASGEDYLEAILVLKKQKGMVRSVDVARHLEVTKPSVCNAVATLRDGGFLTMDEGYFLHLTDVGREVAEQIYEKHRFFTDRLIAAGVDPATAERDACRIEHVIQKRKHSKGRRPCRRPPPFAIGGEIVDEIIIIRAADPDGSVFQAVMDALNGKRAEVVSIAASVAPVLRIRELEIYHKHRRVFMAGKEVHLNHGEYTMLYCMADRPGQVFSKAQLYEAAWGEEYLHGTNSVENTIWRLRRKLEEDPRHPTYIKTVVGMGYKIDIDGEEQEIKNGT